MYVAMGVSGGEEGARKGPSIMPGCPAEAYAALEPILQKCAAQVDGEACVTHCGAGSGCGNYVKMVHNGIEYGDMQLIGEAYTVLKMVGGLSNEELSNVFAEWNKSELDSFLIDITAQILAKKDVDCLNVATGARNEDDTSRYMVDMVLDRTGNKGTGKMTIKEGAEQSTAVPTMSSALATRFISFEKDVRKKMQGVLTGPDVPQVEDKGMLIEDVKNALYCSKIMSYAQGMNLIREASKANEWNVNLGECARIWKGGCIIRAGFLNRIKTAYDRNPTLESLLLDPTFSREVLDRQRAWRRIVALNAQIGAFQTLAPSFYQPPCALFCLLTMCRCVCSQACRARPSPHPCRTSTCTGGRLSPARRSCRRSVTSSAPTPTSARTSPSARCTTACGRRRTTPPPPTPTRPTRRTAKRRCCESGRPWKRKAMEAALTGWDALPPCVKWT